jgi:hypothetical protein
MNRCEHCGAQEDSAVTRKFEQCGDFWEEVLCASCWRTTLDDIALTGGRGVVELTEEQEDKFMEIARRGCNAAEVERGLRKPGEE